MDHTICEYGWNKTRGDIPFGGCSSTVTLVMKVNEQNKKRSVENDIENPTPNAGASVTGEVIIKHNTQNDEA